MQILTDIKILCVFICMLGVWLRTAVCSRFSSSTFTWVLGIKLGSLGFCDNCRHSSRHLEGPENTDFRMFPRLT